MANIELLRQIQKRPAMYFGSSEKPFSLFLAFLSGVGMGHGIDHRFSSLKDSDFAPEGFYEFVAARFAGHYPDGGGTRGWWTFVRENSKSDDEAFDLYIRLLEEFDRANRGKETYGCSLEEGSASLELGCAPDGSGDYLVSLTVRVEGFSGHADGHVAGADWIAFVKAIRNLEETRKGEARFASVCPGEFELRVHAIDSRGHMGISGLLRYQRGGAEDQPQQQLRFAFEFDPSKLPAFARSVALA